MLLSNPRGVLPVAPGTASIAVIGDDCGVAPDCCGAGSGALYPPYVISPLQARKAGGGGGLASTSRPASYLADVGEGRHPPPLLRPSSFPPARMRAPPPPPPPPPLQGITERAGAGVNVTYYPSPVGAAPLTQFYAAARGDHFLDFACEACPDGMYAALRIEGYASPTPCAGALSPGAPFYFP